MVHRVLEALRLLVAVVGASILFFGCGGGGGDGVTYLRDTADLHGVWLSRGVEKLRFTRPLGQGWQLDFVTPADARQVRDLLKLLGALRTEMPLPSSLSDSLYMGLCGQGLQVQLTYQPKQVDRYVLFLQKDTGIFVYDQQARRGYAAQLLGYAPDFINALSLAPKDWQPFTQGVALPSQIAAVRVISSLHPREAFSLELSDSLSVTLRDAQGQRVPSGQVDTTRVSVFLYALTHLPSYPLTAAQQDSVRRLFIDSAQVGLSSARGYAQVTQLGITLRTGKELVYRIYYPYPYATCGVQTPGDASTLNNDGGYVVVQHGEVRRVRLSEWDGCVPFLRDLLHR